MAVDRNAANKLHKSGKSNVEITKQLNMNRLTVWKIVKKFQETGNTLDRPGHGRKCPIPSTPQKQEGKAATKSSPKQQNLGHRSSCEQIHHAPGIEE